MAGAQQFSEHARVLAEESLAIVAERLSTTEPPELTEPSAAGSDLANRIRGHEAALRAEKVCAALREHPDPTWVGLASTVESFIPTIWPEPHVDDLRRLYLTRSIAGIRQTGSVDVLQLYELIALADPSELDGVVTDLARLSPCARQAEVLVLRRRGFQHEADRLLIELHRDEPDSIQIPMRASALYRFAHTWDDCERWLPTLTPQGRAAICWSASRFEDAFTALRSGLNGGSVGDTQLVETLDRCRYVLPEEVAHVVETTSFRSVGLRARALVAVDPVGSPERVEELIESAAGQEIDVESFDGVLRSINRWKDAAARSSTAAVPMTVVEGGDLLSPTSSTGALILGAHENVDPWAQVVDAGRRAGQPAVTVMKGVAVAGLDDQLSSIPPGERPVPFVTAGLDPSVVSQRLIGDLRAGRSVVWAIDSLRTIGSKSLVPWVYQPYGLPVLPAMIGIAAGAPIIVESVARDGDGLLLKRREVEVPPDVGDLRIRSSWLTQRVGRELRKLLLEKGAARRPTMKVQYGGSKAKRTDLVGLDEWHTSARDSLFGWLGSESGRTPERVLMLDDGEQVTEAEIRRASLRFSSLAFHLQRFRHEHADPSARFTDRHRVLVVGRPGAFVASAILGFGAAGSMVGLITDDVTDDQLADRIDLFAPDVIVAPARRWAQCARPLNLPHAQFYDEEAGLAAADDLTTGFNPARRLPLPLEHQPTFGVFTSGSTGRPKLVVSPFDTMKSGALDSFAALGEGDVLVDHARWDSVSFLDTLASLRAGVPVVVPRFLSDQSPSAAVDRLRGFDVTVLTGTPTLVDALLSSASWKTAPLGRLRCVLLWGEPTTPSFVDRVRQEVPGAQVLVQYGTTESPYIAIGEAPDGQNPTAGSPGGYLCPGVEVSDPVDDLRTVTNPSAMLGYFSDLVATDPALSELEPVVLEIPDQIAIDDRGYLMVAGRRTDVAKIGGVRVGIADVRSIVEEFPGVRRAVVLALDDEHGRESLGLVIQSDEPSSVDWSDIDAELRARLGAASSPSDRAVVAALPVLASGKVDLGGLRTLLRGPAESATASSGGAEMGAPIVTDFRTGDADLDRLLGTYARLGIARHHPVSKDGLLPPLDSLLSLELLLAAEELFQRQLSLDPTELESAKTWGDLAESVLALVRPV